MSEQRNEVGEYLRARRAVVQPEDVGIEREPSRRVDGLRREEVARLAQISPQYYLRLEQGRDRQPSNQVVSALARALLLDAESTDYLRRLAQGGLVNPFEDTSTVDDSVLALLGHWSHTPAFVMNRNQDILVSNPLARALGPGYMEPGANIVYQMFSEASRKHAVDWEATARRVVAQLRLRGDPDDPRLQQIVGTLSMRDPDFPAIWARHDTALQKTGVSRHFIDPIGWVEFHWQNLEVPGSTHILVTFWGEPGSPAKAAMAYLASRVQAGSRAGVPASAIDPGRAAD